jgi:aryl-alcohol dehydrogenase-like predicted oxidoreductase
MSWACGPADEGESLATIQEAIESGIPLLDTGDFYGMGHNEMLLRKALEGTRDKVFVRVKFGAQRSPRGGSGLTAGLRRARTIWPARCSDWATDDRNLYQPSRIDRSVSIEETAGAIAEMVEAGYLRCDGLSEASAPTIRRAHAVHPVTALEIEYSLLREALGAFSVALTAKDIRRIEAAVPPGAASGTRYHAEQMAMLNG